jgi:hypothetical protein
MGTKVSNGSFTTILGVFPVKAADTVFYTLRMKAECSERSGTKWNDVMPRGKLRSPTIWSSFGTWSSLTLRSSSSARTGGDSYCPAIQTHAARTCSGGYFINHGRHCRLFSQDLWEWAALLELLGGRQFRPACHFDGLTRAPTGQQAKANKRTCVLSLLSKQTE